MKKDKFNLSHEISIFLADNNEEDCLFFKEALDELPLIAQLISVYDGDQLMLLLKSFLPSKQKDNNQFPTILFLDLNMPRKSGFECLAEIKSINELKDIPIVILSSSLDTLAVDLLYDSGANYYIQKPNDFSLIKNVILQAITEICSDNFKQTTRETFILQPYNYYLNE